MIAVPLLDIRLLGPPEVLVRGAPLVVDTRKALAILALLAADGRPYARSELAAMLWPEADDASARGALRRTLSALRSAVGPDALAIDRSRVGLDRSRVRVDLDDVDRLGRSTDPADLSAAVALARGPFMAGFSLRDSPDFDDWRAARAMSVERSVAAVLDRLTTACEATGDLASAIDAAGRRVDLDPLDEGAHVRLMELHAAAGDRAAALRQYRACVATLDRELGVAPLPETTAHYRAIRDAAPPPLPPATLKVAVSSAALPIVAREGELAAIAAAVAGAADEGRVVVVVGEAGIGKTRLAEAATRIAREAGGTVISTRAFAAEQAIPYGPIVELLRAGLADPGGNARLRALDPDARSAIGRLLPGVDDRPRPGSSHQGLAAHSRLVSAITDALAALVAGPVTGVVWIDDLQWVDHSSLEALAYLLRRLTGRRLLVLLTWRREDLETEALAFTELVAGLPTTTIVMPARLDRDAVATLVAAASGEAPSASIVDELMNASEGLPLYVVEALAAGADRKAMPQGVRAMLRQRLAAVDGAAGQVLTAAAAIGRSFDLPTVRYASGRSEEEAVAALDELGRRALVQELPQAGAGEVQYDFAHGGLRDLAYESTSLARRRLLHRRIAEALRLDLARRGRDDLGRLAQLAHHEREAGREPEAAEAFRQAGDRAAAMYANREAIAHYQAAAALGDPDVGGLHALIGRLRTRLGDYAGAIASLEAAAAVAGPDEQAALELALSGAHLRRGDLTAADHHLEAGLAATTDQRLKAQMLIDRAIVHRRSGDVDRAAGAAAQALVAATASADPPTVGSANRMIGLVALDRGDAQAARASLELARAAAMDDPDPTAAVLAIVGLAMAEAALGRLDLALAQGDAALVVCRRIGDRHLEGAVENHLADLLHAAGHEEEAIDHLRRAVEAFAEVGGEPPDHDPGIWMLAAG